MANDASFVASSFPSRVIDSPNEDTLLTLPSSSIECFVVADLSACLSTATTTSAIILLESVASSTADASPIKGVGNAVPTGDEEDDGSDADFASSLLRVPSGSDPRPCSSEDVGEGMPATVDGTSCTGRSLGLGPWQPLPPSDGSVLAMGANCVRGDCVSRNVRRERYTSDPALFSLSNTHFAVPS